MLKIEPKAGESIWSAAQRAMDLAASGEPVEFVFNEVRCEAKPGMSADAVAQAFWEQYLAGVRERAAARKPAREAVREAVLVQVRKWKDIVSGAESVRRIPGRPSAVRQSTYVAECREELARWEAALEECDRMLQATEDR